MYILVNLVFDGCDCSGKTTLIAEFTKRKRYKVFHFQQPPRDLSNADKAIFQKNHFYLMIDYLLHDDNIIFDRFHIGEQIYGKLFRGYEIDYIKDIENQIKDKCILICVYCANSLLLKRFDNHGIDRNQLVDSNMEFRKLCKESLLKTIFVDTSIMPPKKCYFYVMKELKILQQDLK